MSLCLGGVSCLVSCEKNNNNNTTKKSASFILVRVSGKGLQDVLLNAEWGKGICPSSFYGLGFYLFIVFIIIPFIGWTCVEPGVGLNFLCGSLPA